MGGVQNQGDIKNFPFLRGGVPFQKDSETLLQDAGRVTPLVYGTVMAQISATLKWVPLTDVTAVDGTALAKGVYMGPDIAVADLVAGDVVDRQILVGGNVSLDEGQLVLEGGVTLADVVAAATVNNHVVRDDLYRIGIFPELTVDTDELQA